MERKLWLKIFALLLLALSASVSHGIESASSVAPKSPAGPGPTMAPGTSTAGPESGSSLDESGQVSVSNNNNETSSSSGFNSTTEEETDPLKTSNGNTTVTNSSVIPDTNGTVPENATSPPAPENQTLDSQSQPTTASPNSSSTNKTEMPPVPPPTSPSHLEITNSSQSHVTVHIDSITPTTNPNLPANAPSTPATASSTITTASSATTATTTSQKSSQAPAVNDKATTTHLEAHSDAVSHNGVSPSKLNVREEIVHEGPTLDPLLAGLVSAFIIAAVIITLLLFLKLRRRDSRPEFRRLQDLPMDDMMEDTPLSMYSY